MRTMTRTAALIGALVLTIGAPVAAQAAPSPTPSDATDDARLVLLLDASGSMAEPDATGAPRIDAARAALDATIGALDPEAQVGFRVFGATVVGQASAGACEDTQQVVPVGTGNGDALSAAVDAYQPFGETPIGAGLLGAADDLGTDGQRTILLVSDGLSNCQPDPCQVASELAAAGVGLVVDVVGLNVDDAARQQLSCIADATSGTYFDATDTESLTAAVTAISTRAFRPFALAGDPVEPGATEAEATVLGAGSWLGTVGEDTTFYRIERAMPDSTIRVGFATLNATDRYESIVAIAYPPGGTSQTGFRCADGVASGGSATDANRLATTSLIIAEELAQGEVGPECASGDVIVQIREGGGLAGQRVEIVVEEEPPIVDGQQLPAAQTEAGEGWSLEASGATEDLVPGVAFSDAPIIEPGVTYALEIAPGETQTIAVDVAWGQELRVQATLPAAPASANGVIVSSDIHDPFRAQVDASASDFVRLVTGDPGSMTFAAPRVEYDGRFATCAATCPSIDGRYVIVISAGGASGAEASVVPYTLVVGLDGEAAAGPEYVPVADEPEESAAADPGAAGSDGDGAGAPPILAIGVGVLGVLAIGAGVVVVILRRRASRTS